MPKKITPEEYKQKFAELYPNYELLSDYAGDKNYITVRCKLDGNVWNTKPNWLKQGQGCQKCYDRRRSVSLKKPFEEFLKQAREIHGDKYDYSKSEYVNNHTNMTIICPIHGEFLQTPNKHITQKQGCPKCGRIQNGLKRRLKQTEFINRCNKIHNGKYDYSETEYTGVGKPITIICPKHGRFEQIAWVHLIGCGCPFCNESHMEAEAVRILQENNIVFERQKRFKWLSRQSLDFYLPDYNVAIECQGIQHYSGYNFSWGEDSPLELVIKRDEKKNLLCKQNGVTLYYVTKEKKIFEVSPIYTKDNTFYSVNDIIKKLNNITEETLNIMPAKSKAQQRLFGMVHAYQKGELKDASQEVKDIAKSISKKDAKDFASTKTKKLPNHVKKTNEAYEFSENEIHKMVYECVKRLMEEAKNVDIILIYDDGKTLPDGGEDKISVQGVIRRLEMTPFGIKIDNQNGVYRIDCNNPENDAAYNQTAFDIVKEYLDSIEGLNYKIIKN